MNLAAASLSAGFRGILFFMSALTQWMPTPSKLRLFLAGRSPKAWKEIMERCRASADQAQREQRDLYWFHIASAGELEQAIPLARNLYTRRACGFIITYTSPSAEPFLQNFPGLLLSFPHPLFDAHRLLAAQKVLHPRAVFLVRYDFWPSIFWVCRLLKTPLYLLGATAQRATSGVRASLSPFSRKPNYLRQFDHIFAISAADAEALARTVGYANISVAGEPKWVRAKERTGEPIPEGGLLSRARAILASFRALSQKPVIIFGSPHREETDVLKQCLADTEAPFLAVVAPHDTDPAAIAKWTRNLRAWGANVLKVSELSAVPDPIESLALVQGDPSDDEKQQIGQGHKAMSGLTMRSRPNRIHAASALPTRPTVLLADGVGYLAQLYGLCDIAVVGGGFDGNLHNCLEPAAQGLATLFGDRFLRAPEATELLKNGAARSFKTPTDLFQFLNRCVRVAGPDAEGEGCKQACAHLSVRAVRLFETVPDTNFIILQHLDHAEGRINELPEGDPPCR